MATKSEWKQCLEFPSQLKNLKVNSKGSFLRLSNSHDLTRPGTATPTTLRLRLHSSAAHAGWRYFYERDL